MDKITQLDHYDGYNHVWSWIKDTERQIDYLKKVVDIQEFIMERCGELRDLSRDVNGVYYDDREFELTIDIAYESPQYYYGDYFVFKITVVPYGDRERFSSFKENLLPKIEEIFSSKHTFYYVRNNTVHYKFNDENKNWLLFVNYNMSSSDISNLIDEKKD